MSETKPSYKIRVRNEQHCKKIQDWAFKNGYLWGGHRSEYEHLNASHLYMGKGFITYTEDVSEEFFNNAGYFKEVTTEDLLGKPKPRPVKVGDIRKVYLEDQTYYIYTILSLFEENGNKFCRVQILEDTTGDAGSKEPSVWLQKDAEKDRRVG